MENIAKNGTRLGFISWLQFLGVLFVIFGHSINEIPVPDFFVEMKNWVYTFHMALFFIISGYLFAYKGGFSVGYKKVFKSRAIRLLAPYYIWNICFLIPKALLSNYTNDKLTLSFGNIVELLLYPRSSVLGHTWFLFALFEMFVIAILFEKIRKNKKLCIPFSVLLVFINYFAIVHMIFSVYDLMKYAVFFWFGILLGEINPEKLTNWCKDKKLLFSFFVLTLAGTVAFVIHGSDKMNSFIMGFSVPFFLALTQINFNISGKFIDFVSVHSFPIYIMHWPIMFVIRLVVRDLLHFGPVLCMILMFAGGLVISCLIVLIVRKINLPFFKTIFKFVLGM